MSRVFRMSRVFKLFRMFRMSRMTKMSRMSRKSRMFRYGRGFATSQTGQLPRLAKLLRSVSRKGFSLDPEFVCGDP